jgi:hypothetical protein
VNTTAAERTASTREHMPSHGAILVADIHSLGSTFEHRWRAVSFRSYVDCKGRLFNGGVAANPDSRRGFLAIADCRSEILLLTPLSKHHDHW